ncbi:MAG: hypothetical protein KGZ75_00205 [Syntrophomonadaceae bacterium]|nr:hypothetical protein [Syntrophomonadaceae bacterium]
MFFSGLFNDYSHLTDWYTQKKRFDHLNREYQALVAHAANLLNNNEVSISHLLSHLERYHQELPRQDEQVQEAYRRYRQTVEKIKQHMQQRPSQQQEAITAQEPCNTDTTNELPETPVEHNIPTPAAPEPVSPSVADFSEPPPSDKNTSQLKVTFYQVCNGILTPGSFSLDITKEITPIDRDLSAETPSIGPDAKMPIYEETLDPPAPIRYWSLPVLQDMSIEDLLNIDPTKLSKEPETKMEPAAEQAPDTAIDNGSGELLRTENVLVALEHTEHASTVVEQPEDIQAEKAP